LRGDCSEGGMKWELVYQSRSGASAGSMARTGHLRAPPR
jgi:hypothetical protein